MTEHTLQQFGKELKSFVVLVLLNMAFGAIALGFGMQIIIATFLPSATGEPPLPALSIVRILTGIAGICIGFFWVLASAKILRGLRGSGTSTERVPPVPPKPLPAGSWQCSPTTGRTGP